MGTRSAEPTRLRPLRAAIMLAVAGVLAVGLVAVVHDLARPQIEASTRARRVAQLAEVLGPVRYDNDLLGDVIYVRDAELLGTDEALPVHRARLGTVPVAALLFPVAPDGYSGAIRLVVAIDPQGRLLGVRVLGHRETPGLGDAIETRKSDWIESFRGRSLGDPGEVGWKVRKDGGQFDQFTGATVTPRAVVRAVHGALVYFDRHRAVLFAAPR